MEKRYALFRDQAAVNALRKMPTRALLQTIETIVNVLQNEGRRLEILTIRKKQCSRCE